MKRKDDGNILWSPSDLTTFLESPFASWMWRMRLEGVECVEPDEESADLRLVQQQGNLHEERHLERLKGSDVDLVEVEQFGETSAADTEAAIRENREVVFQAEFSRGDWTGMADFLVLGVPGLDGGRRYEVHDTKLALSAKPYHLIQLCCYAEMLEPITGYLPERIAVVLGNGETETFRTLDFYHYYLQVKKGFEALMAGFDPDCPPPVPAPRASHGRWQSYADRWLDERDHLVRVAGISPGQIAKLENAGITTLTGLATTEVESVPKLGDDIFASLRRQAHAQWMTRQRQAGAGEGEKVVPWFEVIPPPTEDPSRGIGMLPPASSGDIFFDIEGYPLVEGGLEYLLGASYIEDGEDRFVDWWAHDPGEEKAAFEDFIDWVFARWQADPAMHIYHYAPYEITAMRKLMGSHATREDEVDALLRGGVFVDLYRVVRQGILFGDESYSIKKVEKLCFPERKADVQDAASSIVFYANWMASGESGDWKESPLLREIRDYNEEDCISTARLAEWLRERQGECGISFHDPSAPGSGAEADDNNAPVNEDEARRQETAARMLAEIEAAGENAEEDPRWRIHRLLAYLLNFYRREEKPFWWAMFDRLEQTAEELAEDLDCLGGIVRTDEPPIPIKRSTGFEYHFDPDQDTRMREGSKVMVRENRSVKGVIESFDPEGRLVLKVGPSKVKLLDEDPLPPVISLLPDDFVSADLLKNGVERLVDEWHRNGNLPPALRQILLREGPLGDTPLRREGEAPLDACLRVMEEMDEAALLIQGPPGTGKTWTGSHMIASLLAQGKNVGILSNSHEAIVNLLRATAKIERNLSGLRVGGEREEALTAEAPQVSQVSGGKAAVDSYAGGLIAGTAWLFAREDMAGRLDCLFIDEAGQVSLAHLAAVASSASNLVLMGDQMQLGQPIQGSHPGDSGQSILEYALGEHAVVPEDLGVLLDTSWRMHPSVCDFISESVYEGRLRAAPSTEARVLSFSGKDSDGATRLSKSHGILFSPVVHDGNSQASLEEVERILEITEELLSAEFVPDEGQEPRAFTMEDILYVAPYNMQVRLLRDRLPDEAKVGSVDKFQGQEAPVVIISLCASAGEYGGRGLGFILDRNRINVAISRAQTLAIVVADPRIALSEAGSVHEMKLLNLFCKLEEQTP